MAASHTPEPSTYNASFGREIESGLDNTTDEEKTELGIEDTTNHKKIESNVNNTLQEKETVYEDPFTTNQNKEEKQPDLSKDEVKANSMASIDAEKQEQVAVGGHLGPRKIHGWRFFCCIASIMTTAFLFALDTTVVADIQPVIVVEFNDVARLPWLGVAFTLGAAATTLFLAKIYVHFNAKWTYIWTVFLFEAGSAICGASNNMSALIVGRIICGVGGVGMYLGVLTLLSALTTIQERPIYIAFGGLVWGIGTVIGPVLGGGFSVSSATWRWAFYINLCLGAFCAPAYIFLIPSIDPEPGRSFKSKVLATDLLGAILIAGAFVGGVIATSFGGVVYPWNSGQIIASYVISGIMFILFGFQQVFCIFTNPVDRLFAVEFCKERLMVLLFMETAVASTGLLLPLYQIPLTFQFTRGDTALMSAVRLLPFVFLLVFSCMLSGALLPKFGYYMPWYVMGGACVLIGSVLLYTVDPETSAAKIYGYTIIFGFGVGCIQQSGYAIAQAAHPPEKTFVAIGFINFAQITSVVCALSISNAIFLNVSQNGIQNILPNTSLQTIQQAISGGDSSFFNSLDAVTESEVITVIIGAQDKVYVMTIAGGAFALLLSFGMKMEKLFMEPQ